ncbi:MAG: DUF2169 domain-containing protein [Desulfobacteraceae bacterium]|nr:DUF2169 domain-containing protein [Desulfobacteraceae bacterium]MBC2754353.1 DUF2169 domain-containing protein [Desulfobacteraceae bacterium]
MEILNQSSLSFAFITGRVNFPKHSLTLIVKGTFDLKPESPAILSDDHVFPTGDELFPDDDEGNGSCRYSSDFAYYKPRTDILLIGKCYAPFGKAVPACKVNFQAGNHSKTLGVFGDRYWNQITRTISDPKPFTQMDLRYENSFGGSGYKKNPVGKGYAKIKKADGSKIWPLPNIEDIKNLIDSPGSNPEPAGFGPIGDMWIQRYSKLGTYKGSWLKERWPWYPKDFDWGFFNAAPLNMQVEGYLTGDEHLSFENFHHSHAIYKSQLPGLKPRAFLHKKEKGNSGQAVFKEVTLRLDTLWIDMESEKAVLVWRGLSEILTEDYEEVSHCFIVSEKLEELAQPKAHYHELFLKQLDVDEDFQFIEPEQTETEAGAAEAVNIEDQIKEAEEKLNAELIEAGFDTHLELPEPTQEDKDKEILLMEEFGLKREKEEAIDRKIVKERLAKGETFRGEDLRNIDLSGLDMQGVDFKDAILSETKLTNSNLSGAILTNVSLSGVDLSLANLQKAILKDADLTGANLSGADLRDSVLKDAIFDGSKLQNALIDNANAESASFYEADLENASLQQCVCRAADFSKSKLSGADFKGASLVEASVEDAEGIKVNMTDADITGLRASNQTNFTHGIFRNVTGHYSIWENAILDHADFAFSNMEGANFASASLKSASFVGADLRYSRLSKANLYQAECMTMNLFEANLEKADLTMADFRASNIYGAEFLDAVINKTRFENANLKMTKLSGR